MYEAINQVLIEPENIVDVLRQYMNGAAAGLKNGELKYTVPAGLVGLLIVAVVFCCCKFNPCTENAGLRHEWNKSFISFDSFAQEKNKKQQELIEREKREEKKHRSHGKHKHKHGDKRDAEFV